MCKYKGVIFDLDGTLLDTLADLADSVNEMLSIFGCEKKSQEDYKQIIGKGFRNLLTQSFPVDFNAEEHIDEALSIFTSIYKRNYIRKTEPYPGIVQMLEELSMRKIKIGVNSNKRNDYTVALVKRHFPNIHFVGVFGEREEIPKKPDPTAALKLSALMNLPEEKVLYIGDTMTDIETGKKARMGTAGVTWGFGEAEELISQTPDYIFYDPMEIIFTLYQT